MMTAMVDADDPFPLFNANLLTDTDSDGAGHMRRSVYAAGAPLETTTTTEYRYKRPIPTDKSSTLLIQTEMVYQTNAAQRVSKRDYLKTQMTTTTTFWISMMRCPW